MSTAPIEDFTPKATATSDILADDAIALADRTKNEALGKCNYGVKVDLSLPYRESQFFRTTNRNKRCYLSYISLWLLIEKKQFLTPAGVTAYDELVGSCPGFLIEQWDAQRVKGSFSGFKSRPGSLAGSLKNLEEVREYFISGEH